MKSNDKLMETLRTIREIASDILAVARDPCKNLSEEFTEEKIQRNVKVCMRLVDCYAGSWKRPKIKSIREDIEKTQSLVIAADSVLEERMTMNPGTMGLIKSVELMIFNQMMANNPLIPFLAKLGKLFSPYLSSYLHKEFVGFRIQLELHERKQADVAIILDRPIPVQIVNSRRPKRTRKSKGKQTPFMRQQLEILKSYLDKHPVCASYSLITRARQCWNEHKAEWDKAVRNKTGYSCYKTLARSVQYRN